MSRLKFKRSVKCVHYIKEGRVTGIKEPQWMIVSIADGVEMKFSRCVRWGQRLKMPKEITRRLTEDEQELIDKLRKYILQTPKAASPGKETDGPKNNHQPTA